MDRLALEVAIRGALAELRVAWDLVREAPPARPPRVQTLSDSLEWPLLESPSGKRAVDPDAETLETCKCCGTGMVAPDEMKRWTRTDGPRG